MLGHYYVAQCSPPYWDACPAPHSFLTFPHIRNVSKPETCATPEILKACDVPSQVDWRMTHMHMTQ